jgi:hypothetical protein
MDEIIAEAPQQSYARQEFAGCVGKREGQEQEGPRGSRGEEQPEKSKTPETGAPGVLTLMT